MEISKVIIFTQVKKCGIDFRWNMFGMTEKVITTNIFIPSTNPKIIIILLIVMMLTGRRQLGDRTDLVHKAHKAEHQAKSHLQSS